MSDRLDFFEVVKVRDDHPEPDIAGKLGHVLGVSEEEGILYGYGVWIYDHQQVWSVKPEEIQALGYRDELAAQDYGRHGSLKVSPDGKIL